MNWTAIVTGVLAFLGGGAVGGAATSAFSEWIAIGRKWRDDRYEIYARVLAVGRDAVSLAGRYELILRASDATDDVRREARNEFAGRAEECGGLAFECLLIAGDLVAEELDKLNGRLDGLVATLAVQDPTLKTSMEPVATVDEAVSAVLKQLTSTRNAMRKEVGFEGRSRGLGGH